MKREIVKLLSLTMTLMIALSSVMLYNNAIAAARPKIYVDPPELIKYTNDTAPGSTFNVSVRSADWVAPGIFSYQFELHYDPAILEAVAGVIPVGHWLTPSSPANIFVVDPGTINKEAGFVSFGVTLLGTEAGKTGGGLIATITLKILESVTVPPNGNVTSALTIEGQLLVDPTATEIPVANYDIEAGKFVYMSPPLPKPYLSVSSKTWDNPSADAAGRLFNITVSINGLVEDWHVVGVQFFLSFDQTLLATKPEWIVEGGFAKQFGETYFVAYVEGDAIVGQLQLPPWPGPNGWMKGSGVLATIQFNATYRPPPEAECDLTLRNVVLVDADSKAVQYDRLEKGHYMITVAPPPWLSVEPAEVALTKVGETFNLNVAINELDKGFRLVGTEFKVRYNTTLLETKQEWMTEGDFMKDFAQRVGTDTFFQAYLEEDHGLIGIIILPLPNGTWPLDVFPEGSGVLSTIKFNALYQHQTLDITSDLTVYDPLLVNVEAKEIPIDLEKTAEEGTCKYTMKKAYVPPPIPPAERVLDIYTQYALPYGGQGLGVASDAFAPQGQVKLYAMAKYRNDTVPNKPVAYRIQGPGGYEFYGVAFTNDQGIALLEYNIPASEAYFGIWNASASVDIAGQVVSDYVFFRVGWLIEAKQITVTHPMDLPIENMNVSGTLYPKIFKGKEYKVSTLMKIITMQHPTSCLQMQKTDTKIILVYSGFDELNQPLFAVRVSLTHVIGEWAETPTKENINAFVLGSDGRSFGSGMYSYVMIPRTAFSGIGKIYANILTDYPSLGGVPYYNPEKAVKKVWIQTEFPIVPPPAPLTKTEASLKVSSKLWNNAQATAAKRVFNITITISDLDAKWRAVGIEFKLEYDPALLTIQSVFEGGFVKQFGETFFTYYIEDIGGKHILVGDLQLPPWPGDNGWMNGAGTLAIIQFKGTYVPPPSANCVLALYDALLIDDAGTALKFKQLEHGSYEIVT